MSACFVVAVFETPVRFYYTPGINTFVMGLRPCRLRSSFTTTARRQLRRQWSCVRRVCVRARTAVAVLCVSEEKRLPGRSTDGRHRRHTPPSATPVVNTKERPLYNIIVSTGPARQLFRRGSFSDRSYKCYVVYYTSSVYRRTFPFPPTRLFMYYVDDDVKNVLLLLSLNL